jgi:hypothetical protein
MMTKGFDTSTRVHRREEVFELVSAEVADKVVLYLEFGVFEGESMRYWSRALRNPASRLFGFDSFEGLPENWNYANKRGALSARGVTPAIDDLRVQFVQGLFEDTVPTFVAPCHQTLVVVMDADLYSSTDTVLQSLSDTLAPGSYLYFDEFSDRHNELRAFDEFLSATNYSFRLVACTYALSKVMFRRTA